jgi:hypothetical protein
LQIRFSGIVGIVGNYGCGKSEIAINLAIYHRRANLAARIVDLDLVNPYFRSREARHQLKRLGVEVVLPPEQFLQADLPILSPAVAGAIRQSDGLTILDVGGEDVGATVLATLAESFRNRSAQMLQVVNPMRPDTSSIQKCLGVRDAIQRVAGLPITGLIGNANLIDETRLEHLYDGYAFVERLARETGLELAFVTVPRELMPGLDRNRIACPVLPIERQLVPPWKKASEINLD